MCLFKDNRLLLKPTPKQGQSIFRCPWATYLTCWISKKNMGMEIKRVLNSRVHFEFRRIFWEVWKPYIFGIFMIQPTRKPMFPFATRPTWRPSWVFQNGFGKICYSLYVIKRISYFCLLKHFNTPSFSSGEYSYEEKWKCDFEKITFGKHRQHVTAGSESVKIRGLRSRYRRDEYCNSSFFLRQIADYSFTLVYPKRTHLLTTRLLGITRDKRSPPIQPCGLREERRHYVCPLISDEWQGLGGLKNKKWQLPVSIQNSVPFLQLLGSYRVFKNRLFFLLKYNYTFVIQVQYCVFFGSPLLFLIIPTSSTVLCFL